MSLALSEQRKKKKKKRNDRISIAMSIKFLAFSKSHRPYHRVCTEHKPFRSTMAELFLLLFVKLPSALNATTRAHQVASHSRSVFISVVALKRTVCGLPVTLSHTDGFEAHPKNSLTTLNSSMRFKDYRQPFSHRWV